MDFTSRQIRAFLLAAEYGSFTRAADTLLLTPSAVSVLIRELDSSLASACSFARPGTSR